MGKIVKINRKTDQIGKYSFIGATDLQTVIIPATVSRIAPDTFSDCKGLKVIQCEFGKDAILGAPWGAPADCKVQYNCFYENPAPVVAGGDTGGIDTSDATATAGDILYPATAYANGKKITGDIQTVKASASGNTVTVPKGYIEKEQSFTIESSGGGTDISDATVTADAMLEGFIGYNADGSRHEGNIPTVTATLSGNVATVPAGYIASKQTLTIPAVTPTLADNVVTVPQGYIAEKKTLTVAEMAEPSLSANVVTIGKGYNKAQKTVTVAEAGDLTVSDNVVTVPVGYIKTQRTATVPAAAAPTTSGNVVTVNKGYQAELKKITVGTSIAAKTYTPGTADQTIAAGSYLAGKQTIKGDSNLVAGNIADGKTIFGVSGTHKSGVTMPEGITVTSADVRFDVAYIDSTGKKQFGTMNELVASPIIIEEAGSHTLQDGYYGDCTIEVNCDTLDEMNIRAGVNVMGVDGKFSADATATAADIIKGKTAAINGEMITGELEVGGGGEDTFYMATSYNGVVQKITLSGLLIKDDMDELYSLNGEYLLLDESAKGKERVWYCAATTPTTYNGTEYASMTDVCIGCYEVDVGWDDETGDTIYEYYWGICYGKEPSPWGTYYYCSDATLQSPMQVTSWSVGEMYITTVLNNITLAPSTPDVAPYGPTSWNGKKMVWGESAVYITYGEDCLPAAVGYWVRQDSGEITLDSTWINPVSGAKIQIDSKTNGSPSWEIHAYLDYYKGVGRVYTQGNWNKEYGIQSPFIRYFSSALYNVMPQGHLYTAEGTEGWYPADGETTGLEIKKNAPQLGNVYNKDATVKIGAMYPAK